MHLLRDSLSLKISAGLDSISETGSNTGGERWSLDSSGGTKDDSPGVSEELASLGLLVSPGGAEDDGC